MAQKSKGSERHSSSNLMVTGRPGCFLSGRVAILSSWFVCLAVQASTFLVLEVELGQEVLEYFFGVKLKVPTGETQDGKASLFEKRISGLDACHTEVGVEGLSQCMVFISVQWLWQHHRETLSTTILTHIYCNTCWQDHRGNVVNNHDHTYVLCICCWQHDRGMWLTTMLTHMGTSQGVTVNISTHTYRKALWDGVHKHAHTYRNITGKCCQQRYPHTWPNHKGVLSTTVLTLMATSHGDVCHNHTHTYGNITGGCCQQTYSHIWEDIVGCSLLSRICSFCKAYSSGSGRVHKPYCPREVLSYSSRHGANSVWPSRT